MDIMFDKDIELNRRQMEGVRCAMGDLGYEFDPSVLKGRSTPEEAVVFGIEVRKELAKTEIPELLSSIRDDYRFYLRFHGVYSEELVLYGLTGRS